jgi:hypothetical protein
MTDLQRQIFNSYNEKYPDIKLSEKAFLMAWNAYFGIRKTANIEEIKSFFNWLNE